MKAAKRKNPLEEFERQLPEPFRKRRLLESVFVHRSYLNEPGGERLCSYERLEFLGDAVLSAVISHILYERFPDLDEGGLTGLRAKLVNKKTLASIARRLDMGRYLLLGKGERTTGGGDNPTILAGAFEALLAAIYLDRGYSAVFRFTENLFGPIIKNSLKGPGHFDFKPRLQELAQRVFKEQPCYRLVSEKGPSHKKIFEIEVLLGGKVLGRGRAGSKKAAEQMAAGMALERLEKQGVA